MADTYNSTIRRITPAGVVSTLAGLARRRGSDDGTGSTARFQFPFGVATDAAGNVYVADSYNSTIRKITPAGVVSTLADATGSVARFLVPTGVATDASGNVYVAEYANHTIRKITPAGVVTTLAGTESLAAPTVRAARRASLPPLASRPMLRAMYMWPPTTVTRFNKITPAGVVTTLAGGGGRGRADGTGSAARFNQPSGVATDAAGNVYVGDTGNNGIRKGFIPPPRLAAYSTTANGWFVFQISGLTNQSCQIETSTNLNSPANWLPIYTNTAPFSYTNFDIGADSQRFYRATIRQ